MFRRQTYLHNLRKYFHASSSTEELRGNVVEYSKRNEDNIEQCQDFQLGKNSVKTVYNVPTVVEVLCFTFVRLPCSLHDGDLVMQKLQCTCFSDLISGRDAQRESLFQHFYQALQKAWDREKPSDCVIVSMDTNQR